MLSSAILEIFHVGEIMLTGKIKELCKSHGISVPKLEDALGFGAGTISKWKKSSPSVDKLLKVAEYFHVSIDWLVDRKDFVIKQDTFTEKELEIIKIYRKFNSEGEKQFFERINDMLSHDEYKKENVSLSA